MHLGFRHGAALEQHERQRLGRQKIVRLDRHNPREQRLGGGAIALRAAQIMKHAQSNDVPRTLIQNRCE